MKKRLLAIFLSVVMLFTLTAPAFATALPQEDTGADFLSFSVDVCSSEVDANAAAKNVYQNLSPIQQQEFLALIESLAYQGDTQLVEFHKAYVDPSYECAFDGIMPQTAAVAAAADITGQLQALNLPDVVYYALVALATALGVPVGNVVDVVVALGVGAIIVANWDAISGVWDQIVDIFVNAFGSFVMDAFYYLQGLVGVYTVSLSGSIITINGKDYNCDTRADEVALSMTRNGHKYYPAFRSTKLNTVLVAPIDIPRGAALAIMRMNSTYDGVFTIADNYARSLCESLGGVGRGPEGEQKSGFWKHYHCKNYPEAHCWFIS